LFGSIYPCDTADSYIPSLTFAGQSFQINALDFNWGRITAVWAEIFAEVVAEDDPDLAAEIRARTAAADYCMAGLSGTDVDDFDMFVVGDTFLKNWYSVFSYSANHDKPAVLFAPSIGNDML
jgi:hypothetical protein